jgi:hypothetical protein
MIFVRDIKKKKSQDLTLDVKRLNRLDKKRSDYSLLFFIFYPTIGKSNKAVKLFHSAFDAATATTLPHFDCVCVCVIVSP